MKTSTSDYKARTACQNMKLILNMQMKFVQDAYKMYG
jgi:hypothetical protein